MAPPSSSPWGAAEAPNSMNGTRAQLLHAAFVLSRIWPQDGGPARTARLAAAVVESTDLSSATEPAPELVAASSEQQQHIRSDSVGSAVTYDDEALDACPAMIRRDMEFFQARLRRASSSSSSSSL
ncbi:hypothetical protein B0T26DRAFT_757745 [Lasiosphaeria miniovina]|uniref:Uncharacterized protein n=1 Tax=Lasiosphaeria miniovina TaxID=1954250 RepID=A0AA39ZQG5_9PEZI|nr:uncharacterized protein B0T26DRAFT_757745 [Lasiosphaeria miniovina]KAK0701756.1 hypothetical protein B0T26DRAFT_757745 [Lasiosphaeria miniovina]